MTRHDAGFTASMAELGNARAMLERAGGKRVPVVEGSEVVAYLVPAERTGEAGHRVATREELRAHLAESRERVQPVLDWLRDK